MSANESQTKKNETNKTTVIYYWSTTDGPEGRAATETEAVSALERVIGVPLSELDRHDGTVPGLNRVDHYYRDGVYVGSIRREEAVLEWDYDFDVRPYAGEE